MQTFAVSAALIAALLTAVLFAFLSYTVYLVIVHRRYAHIPSPKGASFLFGHGLMLRRARKEKHVIDLFNDWYSECGPVYVIRIFHQVILIALDPESVKTLSTRQVSRPSSWDLHYLFGQRFIKNSILSKQHYEDWKDRRRTFDPAFTKSYLCGLVPVYNSVAKRDLIEPLRAKADGSTRVPMKNEFSRLSLQVISQAAFGADFERDSFVQSRAGEKGLTSLLTDVFDGFRLLQDYPFIKFLPFVGRKYASAVRKLREIGRHCIEQRMRALDSKEDLPQDIMSKILSIARSEKSIEMEDLVDEFLLFYLAGQETTSILLSFSTGLLIQHPDIMERVRDEIEEVLGDKPSVEADDLDKLTYMNQVLEETLRLFCPGVVHKEIPPGGLKLLGYDAPSGTMVMAVAYCLLRSPEYIDDPLKFDPDRFGPGQKRPSPYIYYPFGIGHRSCIGRVFAVMEAKVVLVHLLRAYNLSLPENYCMKLDTKSAIMQPEGGLPCFLTHRQ